MLAIAQLTTSMSYKPSCTANEDGGGKPLTSCFLVSPVAARVVTHRLTRSLLDGRILCSCCDRFSWRSDRHAQRGDPRLPGQRSSGLRPCRRRLERGRSNSCCGAPRRKVPLSLLERRPGDPVSATTLPKMKHTAAIAKSREVSCPDVGTDLSPSTTNNRQTESDLKCARKAVLAG
jgi:hypothetical protein